MLITNRTRNTLLGTRVLRAATVWRRLRGFIGRPEPRQGEGILLAPCNSVHTFLMTFPLDLLFLDERGKVLRTIQSIRPWRCTRPVSGARYVLEVPVGTIDSSGTCVGDELTWQDPPAYRIALLSQQDGEEGATSTMKRRSMG